MRILRISLGRSVVACDSWEVVCETGKHIDAVRWYGEIFLPASTKVVKSGSNTPSTVAQGTNVLNDGYLMIVFDTVETYLSANGKGNNQHYLEYSIAKDTNLNNIRPEDTYIIEEEKKGKGDTIPMILPNGKTIVKSTLPADFYVGDIPVIVYDISLRANNDYTTTGVQ